MSPLPALPALDFPLSSFLHYEALRHQYRHTDLSTKQKLLRPYEKAKFHLAKELTRLKADWPIEIKGVGHFFHANPARQNTADMARETFVLRLGLAESQTSFLSAASVAAPAEIVPALKAKFYDLTAKANATTEKALTLSEGHAEKLFAATEKYLSRTNIGAAAYDKASLLHGIAVVEPLRQQLKLSGELAKIRFTDYKAKGGKAVDYKAELESLPVLRHVGGDVSPIYVDFAIGTVAVATTCFFKSARALHQADSNVYNKSSFGYFSVFMEAKLEYDVGAAGELTVDESVRLLVFRQRMALSDKL